MSGQIAAMLNSNSPMTSPVANMPSPPQQQQQHHHHQMQHAPASPYPQVQYAPDAYDDDAGPPPPPPQANRAPPMNSTASMLGPLLDDPDKKVTLVVLALLIIAQNQQTREIARSIGKSAGVHLADSPYENVIISSVLAACFFYFLTHYF